MKPKPNLASRKLRESALFEAACKATRLLEPNALAVLCRNPIMDEECPQASDVDLIAIWDRLEEAPERITVETKMGRVFVDILWIPASKMLNPDEAASYKTLPHLLLESKPLYLRSAAVEPLIESIKLKMYDKAIWKRRIGHQIGFGDAAVEEAQKNLDFPSAALFFLQTAHAYYITALADCLKHSTMSLLNRPVNKLRQIDSETGCNLEALLKTNLHLDAEPTESLRALRRVYNAVAAKCATHKLQGVSMRTRGHFDYTISLLELEYRELVAKALIEMGDFANANVYLRFWAYSLSRCPIVLEDGRQGRKPSFYVPIKSFKESLQEVCPEILPDMKQILGEKVNLIEAEESIKGTATFKETILNQIQQRDLA